MNDMETQRRNELLTLVGQRAVVTDGPHKGVYGRIETCEHHLTPVKITNENMKGYPDIKWIGVRDCERIRILP
jgi:hypothetical protein